MGVLLDLIFLKGPKESFSYVDAISEVPRSLLVARVGSFGQGS